MVVMDDMFEILRAPVVDNYGYDVNKGLVRVESLFFIRRFYVFDWKGPVLPASLPPPERGLYCDCGGEEEF
jgi:hypothetical protein